MSVTECVGVFARGVSPSLISRGALNACLDALGAWLHPTVNVCHPRPGTQTLVSTSTQTSTYTTPSPCAPRTFRMAEQEKNHPADEQRNRTDRLHTGLCVHMKKISMQRGVGGGKGGSWEEKSGGWVGGGVGWGGEIGMGGVTNKKSYLKFF